MLDTVVTFSIMTTGMPCAPGDGAAGGIVNEDILGALGVTGFQHADTDARIFFRFPLHQVNGRRFIVLDADQTLRNAKPLQTGVDSVQYRVRVLQKLPVVCGQIGLALRAVDEQRVDLRKVFRHYLHVCRKARTTEADNTGLFQCGNKAGQIRDLRRADGRIRSLRPVSLNDYHGLRLAKIV